MASLDLSVVIGFRDWGLDRLRRSVLSLQAAAGDLDAEIIISDYGSSDPSLSRRIAQDTGARWLHTPCDPVWSRSRALNAGFAVADGELLISTDADMLFAPGTLTAVHAEAAAVGECAVFLQCRDLPPDLPDTLFDEVGDVPWDLLERRSRLRPRWGMGGLMGIDRSGFSRLHGFDERLHTYGREDMDFAQRARRAGWRTHWIRDPHARMYHMWHPPTSDTVQRTEHGRKAIMRNRRIVDSDSTVSRNATSPQPVLHDGRPLVSIVVPPGGTVAERQRTIATALAQTVRDVEVVMAGTDDGTGELALDDARVVRPPGSAAAASALTAQLEVCRGEYVSIVRAGDILPLDRTEHLLLAMGEGASGAFGATTRCSSDGSLAMVPSRPALSSSLMRREAAQLLGGILGARTAAADELASVLARTGHELTGTDRPVLVTLDPYDDVEHGTAVPAERSVELRLLLPRDHPGAIRRSAHLQQVVTEHDVSGVDGVVHPGGIRNGSEILRAELSIEGASYADIARLARTGPGLVLTDASGPSPGPAPGWVDRIVQHAQQSGAQLPLALHLDAPAADPRHPHAYVISSRGSELTVRVSEYGREDRTARDEPRSQPWLLVGGALEEVWT